MQQQASTAFKFHSNPIWAKTVTGWAVFENGKKEKKEAREWLSGEYSKPRWNTDGIRPGLFT